MKFKLDENLGASARAAIRAEAHDVSTVVEEQMAGAGDDALYRVCAAEGRVLITCDLDFANPFVFDPRPTAGIIVLRLPRTHGPSDVATLVARLVTAVTAHDVTGELWIVTAGGVRRFVPPDR